MLQSRTHKGLAVLFMNRMLTVLIATSMLTMRLIRPSEMQASLKEGDAVKVVTKDGRVLEFEIVTITPDAIVGKDQRVEIKDIATIEKREASLGRTFGMIGLVYLALFGFAILLLLIA